MTDKSAMYNEKYGRTRLTASPHFIRQFGYLMSAIGASPNSHSAVLDIGGGTGEYSAAMGQMGYNVLLAEVSAVAVEKAKALGVKAVVADYLSTPPANTFDIVLAKGFSPLNTDNPTEFREVVSKLMRLVSPGGSLIVWGTSNMSSTWSESGWYSWRAEELRQMIGETVVFPALRYQIVLPWMVNRVIGAMFERVSSRHLTVISIRKA